MVITGNTVAQGLVEFNNITVDAPIFMPDGTGPGAAGRAQLYLFNGTGYTPVDPIVSFLTPTAEATYYFTPTIVAIPGIPAGLEATVQVRAWIDAPNWESAIIRGESNDVSVFLLREVGARLYGLQSFTLIPEPSSATLAFLSAAALFLTRRRKLQT